MCSYKYSDNGISVILMEIVMETMEEIVVEIGVDIVGDWGGYSGRLWWILLLLLLNYIEYNKKKIKLHRIILKGIHRKIGKNKLKF